MLSVLSLSNVLTWAIVGAIAGVLASLLVRGGGLGLPADIVVGVIGALLGGVVLTQLLPGVYKFTGGFTGFNIGSLIVAFIGAVILLFIVRLVTGRRPRASTV